MSSKFSPNLWLSKCVPVVKNANSDKGSISFRIRNTGERAQSIRALRSPPGNSVTCWHLRTPGLGHLLKLNQSVLTHHEGNSLRVWWSPRLCPSCPDYALLDHGSRLLGMCAQLLSCFGLFVTLWTIAHQAPLSVGSSRQELWSGLPFPSPGNLPNPRIEPMIPKSPALQVGSLLWTHQGSLKGGPCK